MADYGSSDTSTTTLGSNQFPISEVYVPSGTQTAASGGSLTALEGGPASTDSATPAKRSAPVSTYTKDGSDLAKGATTDAAVVGDNSGSISAKLRGLSKIWNDIWDSVNHRIKVDGSSVTQPVSGTFWQATQPVSGTVTANQGGTWTAATNADTAIGGTTAPGKEFTVGGKTNDATPQYQPIPEGAGGRSVIVEGYAGGTAVPVSGTFWQATQPVSGTVTANAGTNLNTSLLALESGGNLATLAGVVSSSKAATKSADGDFVTLGTTTQAKATDATTTSWSVIQLLKGILNSLLTTVAVTQSGSWTEQPIAGTTGGSTPYHLMSASSTNATNVKASAGLVYGVAFANANAAIRYVKIYDKATAPVVGTDIPKRVFQIPASGQVIEAFPVGLTFSNGISFATTTGIADTDSGAVGANDLSIDLDYK